MITPTAPARVLIVDDVPSNVRVLANALTPDYQVQVAVNGSDALDAVAQSPPDLILLDVTMPAPDGHEVCRRLKAAPNTRDIPIIFISGRDEEHDELLGLQLGAVDYITKPFSLPVVKARIATHLELKRYRDLLEHQGLVDGLTGIPNRRRFDQVLAQAWAHGQRHAESVAVIMMDVDFFKKYNDHYGHLRGDECLHRVGQALFSARRRPLDVVARYGGEEFICVLTDTDRSGALAVAEQLRLAVADLVIEHSYSDIAAHITMSLGVAARIPQPTMFAEQLIAHADLALYQAKREGRDRVCAG